MLRMLQCSIDSKKLFLGIVGPGLVSISPACNMIAQIIMKSQTECKLLVIIFRPFKYSNLDHTKRILVKCERKQKVFG